MMQDAPPLGRRMWEACWSLLQERAAFGRESPQPPGILMTMGPPLQAARAVEEVAPLSLGWWPGPTPARHGQALVTCGLGWGCQPQTRRGLLLTSTGFFSQRQPSSCRSQGG